jgi:hypothetical protein
MTSNPHETSRESYLFHFRPSASLPRAEPEVPLGCLDITGHDRQKLNLTQSGIA